MRIVHTFTMYPSSNVAIHVMLTFETLTIESFDPNESFWAFVYGVLQSATL